ncbi:hypothetical protein [Rhodococcus sp. HNM0569]|uniref:hypothetical protein n=1 Tax=Rhodococcus sp. HNM0569 TaxID=2716340 RepID=UPI00146F908F|nr:hypothetical protein [Rhodococcus sp. HNM0569]NLU82574.1 hypothetical protein [Rhodococcus sp. HNM0569]
MRAFSLALLSLVAIAACSSPSSDDPSPSMPGPVASNSNEPGTAAPTENPDQDFGTPFQPRPDIVDARVTPFESWSKIDENTLAVHFVTGTPECYGAYATVEETDTTVTVSIHTGTLPETADKMCILVAVFGTLDVPLSAPLGNREVVSGS